ncbi:MAG: hypothetical protein NC918_00865 [Candidatus Omnitrophica bacterium]|nr:hypothetical protein [Candidatus Omnitrophota bacterium]
MQLKYNKKFKKVHKNEKNYFKSLLPKISLDESQIKKEVKNFNKVPIKQVKKTSKKLENLKQESAQKFNQKIKDSEKKLKKALLRASKILRVAKKSKLSPFFVSPDIALQRYSISKEINKNLEQNLRKKVELKKGIEIGLIDSNVKIKQPSLFERIKRALLLVLRKILAWLNFQSRKNQLTQTGQRALIQLQDLYNLLLLEAYDEQSLAALRVAYGEACFYIMEASRQYYKKHEGRGRENYQEYFDRFIKAVQGV